MTTLFRHILIPHDFSTHATRALKVAAGLAAERRGRLTVLHVLVPYPVTPASWWAIVDEARKADSIVMSTEGGPA